MANHLDVVDQMNEIDRLRAELVAKADEYVRNMAIAIDTRDSEIERLCAELEVTKLERDTALTDRHDTIQNLRAELATERKDFLDLVEQSARDKLALATVRLERDNISSLNSSVIAELAEAKARIAELENKNSYNLQIVREATARIAELEAAGNRLGDAAITGILDGNDALARTEASHEQQVIVAANYAERAERAEEQAHYANGVADLAMKHRDIAEAERDALREALRKIEQETIDHVAVRIARAVLNPSPAEREG